jgi:hypothetical protein
MNVRALQEIGLDTELVFLSFSSASKNERMWHPTSFILFTALALHYDSACKYQIDPSVRCHIRLPSDEMTVDIDRCMHYALYGLVATSPDKQDEREKTEETQEFCVIDYLAV